ncbi:hypothetical protein OAS1_20780 [Bacillus sp. YKCMOAS1]|nr:hypothetical protein OAS1_20780 [Bacillus sp. YKCMOAS1]
MVLKLMTAKNSENPTLCTAGIVRCAKSGTVTKKAVIRIKTNRKAGNNSMIDIAG